MRLYLRSPERRPDPEPLPTDDRRTVLIGTLVWAVLFVVLLAFHDRLEEAGRGWWVWTPVAGVALGLYGLHYLRVRDRRGGSA